MPGEEVLIIVMQDWRFVMGDGYTVFCTADSVLRHIWVWDVGEGLRAERAEGNICKHTAARTVQQIDRGLQRQIQRLAKANSAQHARRIIVRK